MSRNAISANPERYLFKIFRRSMPPDPPRRPKKIFLAPALLQKRSGKLIKRVKIAHSLLQSVSDQFHVIILSLSMQFYKWLFEEIFQTYVQI